MRITYADSFPGTVTLPARAVSQAKSATPVSLASYCTMKKIMKTVSSNLAKLVSLVTRGKPAERDKASYEEVVEGDVYNGHHFEWSRRPLPISEADKRLAAHDAQAECAEWDFQDILEENLLK